MIHLRKVRPKRRRLIPNGTPKHDTHNEVHSLCGAWVQPYLAKRVPRPSQTTLLERVHTCPACRSIAGV